MATLTFSATFSGGDGTLDVLIDDTTTISFSSDGFLSKAVSLDAGNHDLVISGAAPDGPGGAASLDIAGDVTCDAPYNYPKGLILPDPETILVNS
jgi:hypothetical protein